MDAKNRWFQPLGKQGGGRWRVLELTPKMPGPVASADSFMFVQRSTPAEC